MRRWYVAQAQTNREERARINLERQGFEPYLPRYRKQRRHARYHDVVKAPLFPGYIFVRFDVAAVPWRSINGTFGVNYLICHGNWPSAVPDGVVEELKSRENEEGLVALVPRTFREGEALRIVSGAMADCLGLFEKMSDRNRVVLLLNMLGRTVRVEAPESAVAAGA